MASSNGEAVLPSASVDKNDYYVLPRDEAETLRLNAQNHAMNSRQGWRLHPKIQKAIAQVEKPQIADVACGTGIWTFETAEEYPSAFVTGLDITEAQFPPRWCWPGNSRLDILDFAGEIPQEYHGKFDVVHCRFLVAPGPNIDSRIFVNNFNKLLKPGGWLQWEELPYPLLEGLEPVPDGEHATNSYKTTTVRFDMLAKLSSMVEKAGWINDFEGWMKVNSPFKEIEQIDMPLSPQVVRRENNVIRPAVMGAIRLMLQKDGMEEVVREKLREDWAQFERFKAEGKMVAYRYRVCIARAA